MLSRLVRRLARCSRRSGNARGCERSLFRLHALIAFARAARRDRRHPKGLLLLSALLAALTTTITIGRIIIPTTTITTIGRIITITTIDPIFTS
jgi:hypothetical protein